MTSQNDRPFKKVAVPATWNRARGHPLADHSALDTYAVIELLIDSPRGHHAAAPR